MFYVIVWVLVVIVSLILPPGLVVVGGLVATVVIWVLNNFTIKSK